MRTDTTVALLVLICLAGAAVVLTAPAGASHGDDANFTAQPDDPSSDRAPGASGTTYNMWVEVEEPYENVTRFTYRLPEDAFWDCGEGDLRAFGIDRGGDDPGLETDETPPANFADSDGSEYFYDVDGTVDLDAGDEVVASVADCMYNPENEGWYQGEFLLHNRNDLALKSTSHYYWICDCQSEAEARERLGPPPSEPTPTPTPTATATPTATPESTPTATATATATATPEATSTPEDARTPVPTEATDTPEPAQSTDTATPASDSTSTATATSTATEGTPENGSAVQTAQEESPSAADGPGFGLAAALLAIAAAAMLAHRRD